MFSFRPNNGHTSHPGLRASVVAHDALGKHRSDSRQALYRRGMTYSDPAADDAIVSVLVMAHVKMQRLLQSEEDGALQASPSLLACQAGLRPERDGICDIAADIRHAEVARPAASGRFSQQNSVVGLGGELQPTEYSQRDASPGRRSAAPTARTAGVLPPGSHGRRR